MALYYNPDEQTRPPASGGGTDPALSARVTALETASTQQGEQMSTLSGQVTAQGEQLDVLAAGAPEQVAVLARVLAVQAAPGLTDAQALAMPDLFPDWETVLAAGAALDKDAIIRRDGALYRVVQDKTMPQAHQPPGGDGMLAVYRPINPGHAGTRDDPIPWVYGMGCFTGKYYSFSGKLWLCKGDMIPCTWQPGTAGLWQWEEVLG